MKVSDVLFIAFLITGAVFLYYVYHCIWYYNPYYLKCGLTAAIVGWLLLKLFAVFVQAEKKLKDDN